MRIDEFILARVAEDEAVARDTIREIGRIEWVSEFAKPSITSAGPLWCDPDGVGVHVAAEPARVLAECGAKRRIIDAAWCDHEFIEMDRGHGLDRNEMAERNDYPNIIRMLAAVYADHPDFDPTWRL